MSVPTENADFLVGSDAFNFINGLGGNDIIFGKGGDDLLLGGEGDDVLVGGSGGDTLNGGNGFDTANYNDLGIAVSVVAYICGVCGARSFWACMSAVRNYWGAGC